MPLEIMTTDQPVVLTGVLERITGFVWKNVLYRMPPESDVSVDSGRLHDPVALRWLMDNHLQSVHESEYSALRDQIITRKID